MADDTGFNTVPPQNNAPATPAPTEAPDVSNAGGAVPTLPVTSPAAPPAPAPGTNFGANTGDPNAHHSMIGKIFQTLAGGQTTDYVQSDKGPVPVKRDLQPGELARTILASAASLISAGAGGALAAKQHREYQQIGPTVGQIQQAGSEQREEQAQKQFANKQVADEATLRAHRDAMEQQEAIARMGQYADQHMASVQARDAGRRDAEAKDWDTMVKHTVEYNQALAMPGAKVLTGKDGKPLSFATAAEMAQYAAANPDVVHGSTDGTSMFGVIPVKNPQTGSYQLIDYPADRHTAGLEMLGAKKDKDGEVIKDSSGEPVPDGSILDPTTKKPTVLTQRVTPDQARDIKAKEVTQANIEAQMRDRDAQAAERRAQIKNNEDLQVGLDLYDQGKVEKMNDKQLKAARNYAHQQVTVLSKREEDASKALEKAQQAATLKGLPDDEVAKDTDVIKAKQAYDESKSDYNDASTMSDRLAGRTPATKVASRLIQSSGQNIVADWSNGKIDASLTASGLSDEDKEQAKNMVWNKLNPTQQAAIQNQNKATSTANTPKPPQPGAKLTPQIAQQYLASNGGDRAKAEAAAKKDGWDTSK